MARQPDPVHMSSAVCTSAARADVGLEAAGHQFGDERARDQHALVDVEAEIAEPRFVRQIGRGDPLVDPPREQLAERCPLGLRQLGVEEGLEPVERQVQRVQQQVGGLVVGFVAAVTEMELGFAEARYGPAQPVAQRLELAGRDGTHADPTRASLPERSRA